MKKFLYEYKAVRSESEKDTHLRERLSVTTQVEPSASLTENHYSQSATQVGTIRTEAYKRDLAEFQARRSLGVKEDVNTPVKKKCGRHSLPVSCTDCTADNDNTFNYEKKSVTKYKKKTHKRARSATPERSIYGKHPGVPNIQFLFQNQVFMPGNISPDGMFPEQQKVRRHSYHRINKAAGPSDFSWRVQKTLDFKENDKPNSPLLSYNNNPLLLDETHFIDRVETADAVDGPKVVESVKASHNSSTSCKEDSDDKLSEVMTELNNFDRWADEHLQNWSPNSKSEDNKSDTSAYGLPIVSVSNLDVNVDRNKTWSQGKWGVVPVQIKKLTGVTVQHVRKKLNTEINILRQCRHPNIILLMGLYPDIHGNVHIICEQCVDSIYSILHIQGRILSAQTSVQYALDIANALVFLRMQGYLHTELSSAHVMITSHDTAKLADVGACVKLEKRGHVPLKEYQVYSPEPQYVNIDESQEAQPNTAECEPLLSAHPSETYIESQAVSKAYVTYQRSKLYRWHAPELFTPSDDDKLVYPCSKSDVYSLCLILWECCNASLPWKNFTYDKLKEQYTMWKTGVPLPKDGTYPGCLLSLLQSGLSLHREERMSLELLQNTLQKVKRDLDKLGYIIIPARLPTRQTFSTNAWDTTTDSDCLSPQNIRHEAVIHNIRDSSTESEKDYSKSDTSPRYETLQKLTDITYDVNKKCFINDKVERNLTITYEHLPEKEYSSPCSTPIAKMRARIKDMETPGTLHRSDSTEYCSILSPNRTVNFAIDDSTDFNVEKPSAKLSRSFTPKSYKPLHIKVPEFNFESIKPLLNNKSSEKSSYNFNIQNYSLPTTPIARSNKLRKNAWLSGDLGNMPDSPVKFSVTPEKEERNDAIETSLTPPITPVNVSTETETANNIQDDSIPPETTNNSPESVDTNRDHVFGLRRINPPQDFLSPESDEATRDRDRMSTCSLKSQQDRNSAKDKLEDVLANVNVKPLVAIHERWIYEANRKTCRSLSLPEDNRSKISAVKPASHCVDTLQKSLPQLNTKKITNKIYRTRPVSPNNGKYGNQWEQFCQARDMVSKNLHFTKEPERTMWKRSDDKGSLTDSPKLELKTDQSTDTKSIEEFIKDLIRKEFQHLLNEISEDVSTISPTKNEDILSKGVANIIESLNNNDDRCKKEQVKSFSRVKINGNNKPLLQITFNRCGENSLQVLDNCVNVTICDNGGKEKSNQSLEDTLTEDPCLSSLKRCQTFNALQEAKSTEDLYIDDDLSTMQENFGGRVKLIPLHGSLHEILCEKEDDCCLIKVKQENGCDTIYFKCDNSDTESRDAIDGCSHDRPQDTVVFKRTLSVVEERIQRIFPKEKRMTTPLLIRKPQKHKVRPKSEVFESNLVAESRLKSNSSPALPTTDKTDEVEVNIENVVSYQDSSSDESLKGGENDDFELIEQKIEEEFAASHKSSFTCCLEKISEENLAAFNDDHVKAENHSAIIEDHSLGKDDLTFVKEDNSLVNKNRSHDEVPSLVNEASSFRNKDLIISNEGIEKN